MLPNFSEIPHDCFDEIHAILYMYCNSPRYPPPNHSLHAITIEMKLSDVRRRCAFSNGSISALLYSYKKTLPWVRSPAIFVNTLVVITVKFALLDPDLLSCSMPCDHLLLVGSRYKLKGNAKVQQ